MAKYIPDFRKILLDRLLTERNIAKNVDGRIRLEF